MVLDLATCLPELLYVLLVDVEDVAAAVMGAQSESTTNPTKVRVSLIMLKFFLADG